MSDDTSPGAGGRREPEAASPPTIAARAMLALIRLYQLTLSALTGRMCRHLPTCSDYTAQAIRRHGAWAGFWLGLFRIGRCHPWGSDGFDPVPERLAGEGWRFWRLARYRPAGR